MDGRDSGDGASGTSEGFVVDHSALQRCAEAVQWLDIQRDLGLAPRTVDAYRRSLSDFLTVCQRDEIDPLTVGRADIARYVGDLSRRPHQRGQKVLVLDSGAGLANATMQQRLVAVRLFYDYLIEEGKRDTNPVGRGRYTPRRGFGGHRDKGLIPQFTKLPWIPTDEQWIALLRVAREEPIRNRFMLALAYDGALRREELCLLRTDDIDPAHRTLRIRAETTKNRLERVVPYSASTGQLFRDYLVHRIAMSGMRGPLFLSESSRNAGQPISMWTWTKVIQHLADRAGLPRFTTHTLRHLSLTDLARCGWELHAIARFAGHRSTTTTLQYIHLSSRDLAERLRSSVSSLRSDRIGSIVGDNPNAGPP